MARLQQYYRDTVVKKLMDESGFKNVMQVPRIEKITINMGLGEAIGDKKVIENAMSDMEKISGQKPVTTLARKSVASFKVRDGYPIGCKVTLRNERMYEFLDRLFNVAMPRIRDFRGFSEKGFDDHGNYTLGITEQTIFPEVEFDKIKMQKGMNITFVTSAANKEASRKVLELLGLPFRKKD